MNTNYNSTVSMKEIRKLEKSTLTKLRISAHTLHIETGRYSRPCVPREMCVCHTCRLFY